MPLTWILTSIFRIKRSTTQQKRIACFLGLTSENPQILFDNHDHHQTCCSMQHAAFMSLPEPIIFILNYLSQTHTILPVFCLQFSFIYYFAPLLYILLKAVPMYFQDFPTIFPNKSNIFPRFSKISEDFPGFPKIFQDFRRFFQDFPRYFQVPSALFAELPGTDNTAPSARCDPSTPRRTGRSSAMRWRRWCCDATRTLYGDIIHYI